MLATMSSAARPAKRPLSPLPAPAECPIPLAKYESDLLTVENMAEVLDASTRTIYRLVENGDLPHVKVGRRIYFPKNMLIDALHLDGGRIEH